MSKLVSVIIPYYKNIDFISKCIRSIQDQKYKPLEIIVIYDDENKFELKILKKKFNNIKNLKILVNKKNLGASLSRNRGIRKANGDYIAFLDSDDYWKKNKLKKQLRFMKDNFLDFSYTGYDIFLKKKFIKKKINKKNSYDSLLKNCYIGLSTVIISSKIKKIANFPKLKTQEDYALWLKLLRKGVRMKGLPESLSVWRDKPNSLSSNVIQKFYDAFRLYFYHENKNFFIALFCVLSLSINKIKNTLEIKFSR